MADRTRATRYWAILAAGAAAIGAAAALGKPDPPRPAEEPRILYPQDRVTIRSGHLHVIAQTDRDEFRVDGKPQAWEAFVPPVRAARLHLQSGRHRVEIAGRAMEVFVADTYGSGDAPKDWPVLRRHPLNVDEDDRCVDCHETGRQDGRIRVGRLKPSRACFECHREVDFAVIHGHRLEPLEYCQMCHALHGSTRPKLLKAPAKQLCSQCHDS